MTCLLLLFVSFLLVPTSRSESPCLLSHITNPACSETSKWFDDNTSFPAWHSSYRFWEKEDLELSLQSKGSMESAARFFDKLMRGKPITAVAFGSSFVFDAAGCWQTSVEDLRDLGIIPNPILYPLKEVHVLTKHDQTWLEGRCAAGGFMEGIMEWINISFPNPRHEFINNGRGGGTLSMLAEASCISTHTPQHIDLILLDTVTNVGSIEGAEKLLRMLLQGPGQPLVILASNAKHCSPPTYKDQALHERCNSCLRGGGLREAAQCQGLPDDPGYSKEDIAAQREVISLYQKLAAHYNVVHINIHEVVARIVNSDRLKAPPQLQNSDGISAEAKLPLTKFEILGQMYSDAAHLRRKRGGVGSLLVADALHHYFILAKKDFDEKRGLASPNIPPLPPPLHKEARGHYLTRCYGLSAESFKGVKNVDVGSLSRDAWSDIAGKQGADDPGSQNLFQQLPILKVTKSQGWDLQVFYQGKRGRQLKPGWVTNTSGSILEFEVNTKMGPAGQGADAGVDVLLLYTTSYDGWGRAKVECTQGCTCEQHEIDAHQDVASSLLRHHKVHQVTQDEHCMMRLTSLTASEASIKKSSNSQLSKFKLATVTVRLEVKEDDL
jgi:hypothetical protein